MMSVNENLIDVCKHMNVSRETFEKLEIYQNLLCKWNPAINLVSKSSIEASAVRHFADSIQIWDYRQPFDNWVDIGSGAGFPGMVMAIISNCNKTNGHFHLVESDARKSAFLRNVSRETNTPVTVHTARIENVSVLKADVVSARALAALRQLFEYTESILQPGAICLYLKGQNCKNEIEEAGRSWTFEAEQFASQTDENGTVLRVRKIARV